MGWEIVVPEATENLITNPSIENATTGYSAAAGATLARVATDRAAGVACLSVTPTSDTADGVYYAITLATTTTYTFSVSVKGVDGIPYKIVIYDQTAGSPLGTTAFTGDGTWKRYSVTATTGANTSIRLYVQKNTHVSTGAFFVDAMQLEQKAYATTYCDGDQPGCAWSAGAHTSSSTRSAQSAEGGRVRDLATDFGVDVRSSVGVGMPPLELIESQPALSDGADHQRSIARARSFQLVGTITGDDRSDYHSERLALINALNPQRLATDQAVRLRYYNGNNRLEIGARYEGGLEKVNQESPAVEVIGLRFRAQEDPLWTKAAGVGGGQQGAINDGLSVTVQTTLAANYIISRRADGEWISLDNGMGNQVRALAVGPDGSLYAGGLFTTAGGGSANYVAKWNGSSWSALGSGMNSTVHALAVGPDGSLYAGGNFTTAGGGSANSAAKWDGSSWSALSTGTDNEIRALAIGVDGTLYAGGTFTTAGGSSIEYIAQWNGTSWSALGSAIDNAVYALAVGPDGSLYAGGTFTSAMGGAGSRIAKWNGSSWSALGSGMNGTVRSLAVRADGSLYAGGQFTTAGGVQLPDKVARWTGGAWSPIAVDLPGTATIYALAALGEAIVLGFDTSGTATTSESNTATNAGSANAYPILQVTGPGRITGLENFTTGKTIFFDLDLEDGETVELDLRSGKKTLTSTFQGNIINTILPGSAVEEFALSPGDNDISILIDDASAVATLRWIERHWSFDGVAA